MADYWGVKAIAERLHCNESTIRDWHRTGGFLMYMRGRRGHKPAWYTNDSLILAWEISRATLHRNPAQRPARGAKIRVTA